VCNRVAFAGFSLTLPTVFGTAQQPASFAAEQRITTGHLYTRSVSAAGSVLETLTWMQPDSNLVATNVSYTRSGSDPINPSINVTVWVGSGGATTTPKCTASGCVALATRTAGPSNSTTVRYVTSSLAVNIPPNAEVASGSTAVIVAAVADNIVAWPAPHDPSPDAVAAATAPGAAAAASAASMSYWAEFWAQSSVRSPPPCLRRFVLIADVQGCMFEWAMCVRGLVQGM